MSSDCRGEVVLISYGIFQDGFRWLKHFFPSVAFERITHRADRMFNRRTSAFPTDDRLRFRGTHPDAQAEFKRLYPQYTRHLADFFVLIKNSLQHGKVAHLVACSGGHHRSVAFCEIAAGRIRELSPRIRVSVFHFDSAHSHICQLDADGEQANGMPQDEFEANIEAPLTLAFHHPPTFLLHNLLR
jgi:hypothetical protein